MGTWRLRLRLADWLESCAWRIRDAAENEERRKREKIGRPGESTPGLLTFVFVAFGDGDKAYSYLAQEDTFKVGDRVNAPVGPYGHMLHGTVVDVQHLPPEEAPYPLDAIKTVSEILTGEDEEIE